MCFVFARDIVSPKRPKATILPDSNRFDVVTCCDVADVDGDGQLEIILGTYARVSSFLDCFCVKIFRSLYADISGGLLFVGRVDLQDALGQGAIVTAPHRNGIPGSFRGTGSAHGRGDFRIAGHYTERRSCLLSPVMEIVCYVIVGLLNRIILASRAIDFGDSLALPNTAASD